MTLPAENISSGDGRHLHAREPMKVLCSTQPGEGHLNPMLPVAGALRMAGHVVAFASSRSFGPVIEAAGFAHLPAGVDWLESETEKAFPAVRDLSLAERGDWYLTDVFADAAAHRMSFDLLDLCRSWKPDLLLRNDYEFGACVAGERSGTPYATVGISFLWPESVLEPRIGPQLAYLRSAHGLPPYPALEMLYRHPYLTYVPPELQPRRHSGMIGLRPDPIRRRREAEGPAWLRRLGDRPVVYASMGTVNNREPGIFSTILEALRDEPIDLILTVGRNQDARRWGPQPEHVHIESYVPQEALLPFCDVFITNSSFFTVLSAVWHSVPVLMVPLAGDEVSHAARFAEMGIGPVLLQEDARFSGIDASTPAFSAHSVRASVREILRAPAYRERARRLSDRLHALPGSRDAVDVLASHASSSSWSSLKTAPLGGVRHGA